MVTTNCMIRDYDDNKSSSCGVDGNNLYFLRFIILRNSTKL